MAKVASNAAKRMPSRIGGKYRPIRILGHGGMSVVYEVEHAFTKEHLALKVLNGNSVTMDAVSLARFRREARMSALMRSEHVVRAVDADIDPELGGAPYLVMDLLDGADLATVAGRTPQPAEKVVGWFRHVARALDLAHQYGVVHRDLKPENLFLTRSSTGEPLVKVLDFGVASIPVLDDATATKTGAFVGTPLFMSPEQASGAEVTPAADVWSVGMSIFRLLSGEDYWVAPNVTLLLARIVYEDVQPPSRRGFDRGPEFDEWFLKSCARDPAMRWSSVGEQIEALAASLGCAVLEIPTVSKPTEALPRYESADFRLSERYADRAHSLGGSVSPTGTQKITRWATGATLVAFAGAAITVALQFRSVSVEAPAQSARARQPEPAVPSETAHRAADGPPVTAPPLDSTLAELTPPPAALASVSTAERPRTATSTARPKSKRPAAAAASLPAVEPAAPASRNTATPEVQGKHDPLADPD